MTTHNTREGIEQIRFNPRAGGKEILTDRMIVKEVRKGGNYVVWKSPKTTVHIIPDSKLREMFHHQELQKAREEMRQETMRKVMSKLRNQFNSEDDELSLEEIEVALYELDHSELDQPTSDN